MEQKIDGRHHRARSSVSKYGKPKSEKRATAMRARLADPEYRARAVAQCAEMRRVKFANPDKRKHSRFGVFDGMRREQSEQIWAAAKAKATRTIQKMQDTGVITQTDDPRAIKALEHAIEVLETPSNQQLRLAAARLILDFTKSKPAAKLEHTINAAEQWLAAVSDDDEPETPKDATETS